MKTAQKLYVLVAVAVLCIVTLAASLLYSMRALLMHEREAAVQQVVESARNVLVGFHAMAKAGEISEDEAKKRALKVIAGMRYGDNEYFFINDMHPRMVMHPIKPELDGKDLTQNKDPNGKFLFVEFVKVVKSNGSGFVNYLWPKQGSDSPVAKVSYVAGFAPWQWIIGSGVYIDNVQTVFIRRAGIAGLVTLMIAIGLAVIGYYTARNITRQLGGEPDSATMATSRIAGGDLVTQVEITHSHGNSLMSSLDAMRSQLDSVISEVHARSERITGAVGEISAGSADLSHRTEAQSAALERSASSMEQITATIRQNADNADQATGLADVAAKKALECGISVEKVVETMGMIQQSSVKIVDIISVIESIAFQTNILALNAAVESARAGENGRGFAVVASEVRNLAQRSAGAAKEIKSLIVDSAERVRNGSNLVDETAVIVKDLVANAQKVSGIISEIGLASKEQAQGAEQINQGLASLEESTQQNAALAEESAAASLSLGREAQGLDEVVKIFKTSKNLPGVGIGRRILIAGR